MSGLFQSVNQLEGAMTFHRKRHMVLAGNVANVDTPDYRPMDIERVARSSASSTLSGSRAGHFAHSSGTGQIRVFEDAGELQSANGNAVNLERELAKIDANRVRYDTSSALVSRRVALLKYAAADGIG